MASSSSAQESAALDEGRKILKDTTDQIESIKNDPSIPTRSNKKTGARSKKEVREELQNSAREKLKEISQKHNYLCGKWLMFASAEKVDMIWSSLATSLVEGPLAATPAFRAKVATSPRDANPNYQHVICLYLPNVYDKNAVTKVMQILLRNHGFSLSGVKSDMYTMLGIDSKHASGIPSTIWKNKDLMSDKEMQELKGAFFAELKGKKNTNAQPSDAARDAPAPAASKSKPKKKKADVFASDDDDEDDDEQRRKDELAKKKKVATGTTKRTNDSDDEEEEEKPKRKIAKKL